MEGVSMAVSQLNGRMEEAKARARGEVLGRPAENAAVNLSANGDVVALALEDAGKEMREVMDRLTWWKMVWRVDEISHIITQAMQRTWCRNLERQVRNIRLCLNRPADLPNMIHSSSYKLVDYLLCRAISQALLFPSSPPIQPHRSSPQFLKTPSNS
jgi:hypothetical protein